VLTQRLDHPLIWRVDWIKVQAGSYAVVDPNDPAYILYLVEAEYKDYWKVAQSNRATLIVLARPGESMPSESSITASKPTNQNSPTYYFRKARIYSRVAKRLFSSIWTNGTVVPHKGNLMVLFSQWANTLRLWTGHKVTSSFLTADSIRVTKHLRKVLTNHGLMGLSQFLKVSLICINKYLAGEKLGSTWDLKFGIRLANGLPTWIPVPARRAIRARSHAVIRVWLSLCYVYKAIYAPGYPKLTSISTSKWIDETGILEEFKVFVREVYLPYLKVTELPLKFDGSEVNPLVISYGPNGPAMESLVADAVALRTTDNGREILDHINEVLALYQRLDDFSLSTAKFSKALRGLLNRSYAARGEKTKAGITSRLVCLYEAAGKVRVIAMLDYFSQWALRPMHDALMSVLRKIRQDGTHDQDLAVSTFNEETRGLKGIFCSLDISSATDMIPSQFYEAILEAFGCEPEEAQGYMNLLTNRDFKTMGLRSREGAGRFVIPPMMTPEQAIKHLAEVGVPLASKPFTRSSDIHLWITQRATQAIARMKRALSRVPSVLRYTRGQPMGALSSFPLLGLWHHCFVQFAAYRVGRFPIQSYRVLGDDSVFFEEGLQDVIANSYLELARLASIPISLLKSYRSKEFFNFASRSFLNGIEVTPLSLKAELKVTSVTRRVEMAFAAVKRVGCCCL